MLIKHEGIKDLVLNKCLKAAKKYRQTERTDNKDRKRYKNRCFRNTSGPSWLAGTSFCCCFRTGKMCPQFLMYLQAAVPTPDALTVPAIPKRANHPSENPVRAAAHGQHVSTAPPIPARKESGSLVRYLLRIRQRQGTTALSALECVKLHYLSIL